MVNTQAIEARRELLAIYEVSSSRLASIACVFTMGGSCLL